MNGDHSFGLIAISPLATADTPQINPTGNNNGPDSLVPSKGKKIATCAADAAAKPVINALFEGSEKLFWTAASCTMTGSCMSMLSVSSFDLNLAALLMQMQNTVVCQGKVCVPICLMSISSKCSVPEKNLAAQTEDTCAHLACL